jgi:Integrase core domain
MRAIAAVRKLQENPELGEFRVHAALAQIGIHLSPRTCGRILALNRALYGLEKPSGGGGRAKTMPFASGRRHEFWTADVRYLDAIDEHELGGRAYVVSILENHGRAILASAVSPTQDLSAFLSVLYRAVERYGAPEALVTDGGSVFRANQAKAVYEAAGVAKHEIERGKPWQSYVETTFNIQRHMANWHTAPRAWSAPSSPRAFRGSSTPWATRRSGGGASTARRRWLAARPPCGCTPAASRWSTRAGRSPATTSSARPAPTGWPPSPGLGSSKPPTPWCNRGSSVWTRPSGSRRSSWTTTRPAS